MYKYTVAQFVIIIKDLKVCVMIKIGIICPSEIAYRRFIPALKKAEMFQFVGVGVCNKEERFNLEEENKDIQKVIFRQKEKAKKIVEYMGGRIFESYEEIVSSDEIDAIYIPLPPALHYRWAKKALEYGKHVLVEKPATIAKADTLNLIKIAEKNNLAFNENYMFVFHKQIQEIDKIIQSGEIGNIRLYSIKFGFPERDVSDFRYNKSLGGGALLDAGGYTIKYASMLLGETTRLICAKKNYENKYNVDIYGSATLVNDKGITVQVAFGMDNDYKCELEAWGSKGCLKTERVLTAPVGFSPQIIIKHGSQTEIRYLSSDDTFYKSILDFKKCIDEMEYRKKSYESILRQAELIDEFEIIAKKNECKER